MTTFNSPKIYFPGLNALRFFAAAFIVIGHTEQQKEFWGLPSYRELIPFSFDAVTFFFVLSGFLITYLLLKEKDDYRTINIKKFYLRRILRIWPLYFLIIVFAFLILPFVSGFSIPNYSEQTISSFPNIFILYLLILPNVAHLIGHTIIYATQLWSIGVEEQFYIIWPHCILKTKNYLLLICLIIISFIFLRNGTAFISGHFDKGFWQTFADYLNTFLQITRIQCMAIGGLGAYLIYKGENFISRLLINRFVEICSYSSVLILGWYKTYIPYVNFEVYSILFCIIIINTSYNPKSLFRLENSIWKTLGNISYGIYMYHLIGIGVVLCIFKMTNITTFNFYENLILHISSQIITYIIAYLSFKYFETPFLKLKQDYTLVKSGTA